ncbi:MAG: AAA family ATPase [Gammaproteobacteria bacterium]|nr:AAA family ATPase [Gammaproteobacteria bacterium]
MSKEISYPAHYQAEDVQQCRRIHAWLAVGSHSQAELARAAGVDGSTMSQVINGKFLSPPAKWLLKLVDAIDSQLERDRSGRADIPFCETSIYKSVDRICRRAHSDQDIGVYYGAVGIGKTTALREYARRSPSAIIVEAFDGIDNSTFVRMVVTATGTVIAPSASLATKIDAVINALRTTDRVILVDEADHLPDKSFGALRRISDIAQVGVVLVGNIELLARLTEATGCRKQLCDRVGFWPSVAEQVSGDDIRMMVHAYLTGDETLGEEVLKAFEKHCKGRARPLRNLLRNTWRYARNNKTAITASLISDINSKTMAGLHAMRV